MTAAVALGATTALIGGFTYGSAEAYTQKELKICWADTSTGERISLPVVADGPSYRRATIPNGQCVAWDVKPGRYKITVNNLSDFADAVDDACEPGPEPNDPALKIRVKRQNHPYQVYSLSALLNGGVETNVRNNRATTVSAHLRCV